MKTLKTLFVLVLMLMLFYSCQQKSSDEKTSTKKDSLSVKKDLSSDEANNEYAILCSYFYTSKIEISYGNNNTENFVFPKKKNVWCDFNSLVDAFNHMSKNGWDLKNSFIIDNNGTQAFIFKKVK